jgi:hypothetical protein
VSIENYIQNLPEADILMNSMRSMGYSFESAVADVIDNSIAAEADTIRILMPQNDSEDKVFIFDNGSGMDREELIEAMRYGSNIRSRNEHDLGRFGLGLKSASLSQCRRLTVISMKNETMTGMQWDIDFVLAKKDWLLRILSPDEIVNFPRVELFEEIRHGTLVIWEGFDTLDSSRFSIGRCLNDKIIALDAHLSLIFHRFMDSPSESKIDFYINQKKLSPLDPFLSKHKKTKCGDDIIVDIPDSGRVIRRVEAKPFILPHYSDLTEEDRKLLGGIERMKTEQGFYVYRNRRLIVWGSWFGMRPTEELSKYARIKVDIPNTLDDVWQIDIRKQRAVIPGPVRARLTKAVEKSIETSIKQNKFRGSGKKLEKAKLWYAVNNRGKYEFRINRDALIFHLLQNLDDRSRHAVELVLDEIEKLLPYNDIYITMAEGCGPADRKPSVNDVDEERLTEVEALALMLWNILESSGKTDPDDILETIFSSEPFIDYRDCLSEKIKKIKTEKTGEKAENAN